MFQAFVSIAVSGIIGIFAVNPSSTNFDLKAFEIGTGGSDNLSSTNYNLNAISGQQSGGSLTSTNYIVGSGAIPTQNANITAPPTVTNPANYYNRLSVVIDDGGNPSDTTYLIAVSDDNFITTFYVQTDNSIGPALSIANYQTYSAWGGGSGFTMLGLSPSKTYQVKVKALQGDFTESAYSDVASAATVATSLSFSVATSITSTPPFNTNFSSLIPNTVVDADATAELTFSTNAANGGTVYVVSSNSGLVSSLAGNTIGSLTADLSIASTGYGAIVSSTSQASGGPIVAQNPYNGAGNNVGGLSSSLASILESVGPITSGASSVTLKARSSSTTPSSADYSDTVTFIASASF